MSYISAIREKDEVLVWERNKSGRELKHFREPFTFYTADSEGKYKGMHGESLIKHTFDNFTDCHVAALQFKDHGVTLFESDIPQELKVLSNHYYGATPPVPHVTFYDIEVDYDKTVNWCDFEVPVGRLANFYRQLEQEYETMGATVTSEESLDLIIRGIY